MDAYSINACLWCGIRLFNISGSLYVDQETSPSIRSSAQGVFMIMTNGFGALIGSYAAGYEVDHIIGQIHGIFLQVMH